MGRGGGVIDMGVSSIYLSVSSKTIGSDTVVPVEVSYRLCEATSHGAGYYSFVVQCAIPIGFGLVLWMMLTV